MHRTLSDSTSRWVLAPFMLLSILLLVAPAEQAQAQTRSFQMSLWGARDYPPSVDADVPMFYDGEDQPGGFSILILFNWNLPVSAHRPYDWARILAVLVDEPYNDFNDVTCWTKSISDAVRSRMMLLSQRAVELESVSPLTRFWVNYAEPQLKWLTTSMCTNDGSGPPGINHFTFDVVSVDVYHADFDRHVKKYYDYLTAHRAKPDQQVALIPGTFYIQGKDSPIVEASRLQGYFNYANTMNQNCNLPLGRRGRTGSFDGCPVWMVMGWLSHNHTEAGLEYVGERDPRAALIAGLWQAQVAVPLRSDLANQRKPAELVPTFLPLLLE